MQIVRQMGALVLFGIVFLVFLDSWLLASVAFGFGFCGCLASVASWLLWLCWLCWLLWFCAFAALLNLDEFGGLWLCNKTEEYSQRCNNAKAMQKVTFKPYHWPQNPRGERNTDVLACTRQIACKTTKKKNKKLPNTSGNKANNKN